MEDKGSTNGAKTEPKRSRNGPQMEDKGSTNGAKTEQKRSINGLQMEDKGSTTKLLKKCPTIKRTKNVW